MAYNKNYMIVFIVLSCVVCEILCNEDDIDMNDTDVIGE